MTYPTKKLGDILDYEQPNRYIVNSKNYSDSYTTPVLTPGKSFILGYTDEKDGIYSAELPVIIFDDFTTASRLVDFQFKVKSSAMKILHAKRGIADIKYVFHLMQCIEVNHNTHKRYWISEFSKKAIPLPPLPEQKKIVKKIEELFGKIDEAQKLREEASTDASALIPAALYQIFEKGRQKGWREQTVNEVTKQVQYGYTASAKQSGNSRLLRITDIQNSHVNWDSVPYCDCKDIESYKLREGDIVFARTGATVGKSYLITSPPQNAIFASYLIRAVVDKQKCFAEFLYYFFQSPYYWDQIVGQKVGGAQPNVNGTKLKKLIFPLPPLPEQKKIVAYLDSLSEKAKKLQVLQQQTAEDMKELKQSILQKAFEGELV